ncbi:hypothetical protein L484_008095 [Morus notabilis]|uniref:Uncharacterized protein n=1 Tax=Morus notabilis TaxID=981085 RepID=W9R310_9ROSA|nr:hypothetical protein L484_008095 [Morus notabilis]
MAATSLISDGLENVNDDKHLMVFLLCMEICNDDDICFVAWWQSCNEDAATNCHCFSFASLSNLHEQRNDAAENVDVAEEDRDRSLSQSTTMFVRERRTTER